MTLEPRIAQSCLERCTDISAARRQYKSITDKKQQAPRQRSALQDVVTREYTINVHKRTHDLSFKKSAFILFSRFMSECSLQA
jgi:hypothetical protein